jgi:hypothetical protein
MGEHRRKADGRRVFSAEFKRTTADPSDLDLEVLTTEELVELIVRAVRAGRGA